MDCRQARDLMIRKAGGEVGNGDESLLRSHVESCPDCSGLDDQLERAWMALDHYPEVEPSAAFLRQLKARIRDDRNQPKSFHFGWWKWPVAAALCLALVSVLLVRTDRFRISSPNISSAPPAAYDRSDDLFLQDLDQALQGSLADALAIYDSWPNDEPGIRSPKETQKAKPLAPVLNDKEPL
jgi:hypothetical protein